MAKLGNDTTLLLSVTEMTMLPAIPTSSALGKPCKVPVKGSKSAQPGLFTTENSRASPSLSDASDWKEYQSPTRLNGAGSPHIDGTEFCVPLPPLASSSARSSSVSSCRIRPCGGASLHRYSRHPKRTEWPEGARHAGEFVHRTRLHDRLLQCPVPKLPGE